MVYVHLVEKGDSWIFSTLFNGFILSMLHWVYAIWCNMPIKIICRDWTHYQLKWCTKQNVFTQCVCVCLFQFVKCYILMMGLCFKKKNVYVEIFWKLSHKHLKPFEAFFSASTSSSSVKVKRMKLIFFTEKNMPGFCWTHAKIKRKNRMKKMDTLTYIHSKMRKKTLFLSIGMACILYSKIQIIE